MKQKLIELIKKYRAESERCWNPIGGYQNTYWHGKACTYDKCADDLEGLLRQFRRNLRIGIREKHNFDDREGDISQNAGQLYFKKREKERELEGIRKKVIPNTHTGRIAEGKSEFR